MVLGVAPFWFFSTFCCLFFIHAVGLTCSKCRHCTLFVDLGQAQLERFSPKTVVFRKKKLENPEKIKMQVYGYSLAGV